ncbi:MAG: thioredoxin domain-containing protein [Oscillospiraceae bacterium]|nr:thioredoxin domain-containing protein [Oscillospiraceae bacterium]
MNHNINHNTNRLASEKSPYLHQHANNPVDWFPWGEEAFEKARREDKPVFLSIGYSTCHWCHVMEKESFCDSHVAELLNTHFVSVKVDREERPDVDSVYMSVCQALTGAGGWPLTILTTPEKKPFYAGTYLSREDMARLITRMNNMWRESRRDLIEAGEEIQKHINRNLSDGFTEPGANLKKTAALDGETVLKTLEIFAVYYDEKYGGFGTAPKFPSPHNLLFLLEYDRLSGSETARMMVKSTLAAMYRGGIFDHIAGGFSRYSTDDKWLVPHFEKMLYDNALLAWVYLYAYELYGENYCKTAAQKIFSWAFAELQHPDGAFYCGQDADSDGVEGKYYLFRHDEIGNVIGEDNAERYRKYYGMTKKGNFHEGGEGENILNLIKNPHFNRFDETSDFIDECNRAMYRYRRERAWLHTDDKVLTAWNSLMIVALVKAYEVLGDESYLVAAKKTEKFISENLSFAGRLYVRWRDGEVLGNGKLDDYAGYSLALLHLYKATDNPEYLNKAMHYANVMAERFFDYRSDNAGNGENGGFYLYADDDEQLISRPKEIYDGAMPSGNSMAFMVLDKLRAYSGEAKWHELYKKQARFIAAYAGHYPTGCAFSLITVLNESAGKSCKGGRCRDGKCD